MSPISRGLIVLAFFGFSVEVFGDDKEPTPTHYLLPLIPATGEKGHYYSLSTKADAEKICDKHVDLEDDSSKYVAGKWIPFTKDVDNEKMYVYKCDHNGFLGFFSGKHVSKIEYTIGQSFETSLVSSGHVVELTTDGKITEITDTDGANGEEGADGADPAVDNAGADPASVTNQKLFAVIVSKESDDTKDELKKSLTALMKSAAGAEYFTEEALAASAAATMEAIKAANPDETAVAEGIRILATGDINDFVALERTADDEVPHLVHMTHTGKMKHYGFRRPWLLQTGGKYAMIAGEDGSKRAEIDDDADKVQMLKMGSDPNKRIKMYVLKIVEAQAHEMNDMLDSIFHESGFHEKNDVREEAMNGFFSCYVKEGDAMTPEKLKTEYALISDLGGDLIEQEIQCPTNPKILLKMKLCRSFLGKIDGDKVPMKVDEKMTYMPTAENGEEAPKNIRQYVKVGEKNEGGFVRVTKLANLFEAASTTTRGYKIKLGEVIGSGASGNQFPELATYLQWKKKEKYKLKAEAAYVIRYNVRIQFCSLKTSNAKKECFLRVQTGDEVGIEYSHDNAKETNVFAYGKQEDGDTLRLTRGPYMMYNYDAGAKVTSVRAWGAHSMRDNDSKYLGFNIGESSLWGQNSKHAYKTLGETYCETKVGIENADPSGKAVKLWETSNKDDWVALRTVPDTGAMMDAMYSMSPRIVPQDGKYIATGLADYTDYYINGDKTKKVKADTKTGISEPFDLGDVSEFCLTGSSFFGDYVIAMANKVDDIWETEEFEFAVKWDIKKEDAPKHNNFFGGGAEHNGGTGGLPGEPGTVDPVEVRVFLIKKDDQETIDEAAKDVEVDPAVGESRKLAVTSVDTADDVNIDEWTFEYSKTTYAYFKQQYERQTGFRVESVKIMNEAGEDLADGESLDEKWDELIVQGTRLEVTPGAESEAVKTIKMDAGFEPEAKMEAICKGFEHDFEIADGFTAKCDADSDGRTVEGCSGEDCSNTIFFCRVVKKMSGISQSIKPKDTEEGGSETWLIIVIIAGCACVAAIVIGIYFWMCRGPREESSLSTEAKVELSATMNEQTEFKPQFADRHDDPEYGSNQ